MATLQEILAEQAGRAGADANLGGDGKIGSRRLVESDI
ncbi:hypothetical protein FHS42_004768 [Streptomyces zagrosensis]|uniref:Uncharacterized protein n=1 Tax=Streptomyces zagrosensis TaxID=1042984 RepID=A0A7W9QER6_9ACTN|nr:hypothetical protein [Streptomyces zagrosensis]